MTTTGSHSSDASPRSAGSAPPRVVTASRREDRDPPEPWESPASEADLAELSTRRFERLPHRPASQAEVPAFHSKPGRQSARQSASVPELAS